MLGDGEVVVEDVVLRAEAERGADLVHLVLDVAAEDVGRALVRRVDAAEHEGGGGLAGAVVAEKACDLVLVEVDGQVVDDLLVLEADLEVLGDVLDSHGALQVRVLLEAVPVLDDLAELDVAHCVAAPEPVGLHEREVEGQRRAILCYD